VKHIQNYYIISYIHETLSIHFNCFNYIMIVKWETSQKICLLYAKKGETKNRTLLLLKCSVFIWRSVAECILLPFLGFFLLFAFYRADIVMIAHWWFGNYKYFVCPKKYLLAFIPFERVFYYSSANFCKISFDSCVSTIIEFAPTISHLVLINIHLNNEMAIIVKSMW